MLVLLIFGMASSVVAMFLRSMSYWERQEDSPRDSRDSRNCPPQESATIFKSLTRRNNHLSLG
jgi:hypothetical protein